MLAMESGRRAGLAPARGGRAVLLAEGTLQEQLSKGEGGEAVAAGVKSKDVVNFEGMREYDFHFGKQYPVIR